MARSADQALRRAPTAPPATRAQRAHRRQLKRSALAARSALQARRHAQRATPATVVPRVRRRQLKSCVKVGQFELTQTNPVHIQLEVVVHMRDPLFIKHHSSSMTRPHGGCADIKLTMRFPLQLAMRAPRAQRQRLKRSALAARSALRAHRRAQRATPVMVVPLVRRQQLKLCVKVRQLMPKSILCLLCSQLR